MGGACRGWCVAGPQGWSVYLLAVLLTRRCRAGDIAGLRPLGVRLARFSVTLRKASCFLARFLAAASLAIFSPSRSLRPGSRILKAGPGVLST